MSYWLRQSRNQISVNRENEMIFQRLPDYCAKLYGIQWGLNVLINQNVSGCLYSPSRPLRRNLIKQSDIHTHTHIFWSVVPVGSITKVNNQNTHVIISTMCFQFDIHACPQLNHSDSGAINGKKFERSEFLKKNQKPCHGGIILLFYSFLKSLNIMHFYLPKETLWHF